MFRLPSVHQTVDLDKCRILLKYIQELQYFNTPPFKFGDLSRCTWMISETFKAFPFIFECSTDEVETKIAAAIARQFVDAFKVRVVLTHYTIASLLIQCQHFRFDSSYRNSLPYWDLPTTESWAISEPLMYHGTVLIYYGTMSQAVRLRTQSSLVM